MIRTHATLALTLVLVLYGCKEPEPDFQPGASANAGQAPAGERPSARKRPPNEARPAKQAPTKQAEAPAPTGAPAQVEPPSPEVIARLMSPPEEDMRAPERYTVELDTTAGTITMDCTRAWAPVGADHFYTLVKLGYYTDVAFFRVVDGFMAQAGMHGTPGVNNVWQDQRIQDEGDDIDRQSNTRGMVSFAKTGAPNSRANQFFINFSDNSRLDPMGFTPLCRVRDMAPVDNLFKGYGESAPRGQGPMQGRIGAEGNAYLRRDFPNLSYIRSARVLED